MSANLMPLEKQYLAAMSAEMKSPLQKIIDLVNEFEKNETKRTVELKDAARYLLSLVDELTHFAKSTQP